MRDQFTQQLLVGDIALTFLFTERIINDNEAEYMVSVINNTNIAPFRMYFTNGHFEIADAYQVPQDIRDAQYQLNQAINNYHIMQSLLHDKEPLSIFKSNNTLD